MVLMDFIPKILTHNLAKTAVNSYPLSDSGISYHELKSINKLFYIDYLAYSKNNSYIIHISTLIENC